MAAPPAYDAEEVAIHKRADLRPSLAGGMTLLALLQLQIGCPSRLFCIAPLG
jgi:hypothetical protein